MMTNYRSVVLLFALLLLGLTACGGEDTKEEEVDHPTVRLQVGDNTYGEKVYSYCWPASAANVVCDTNYDVREQPSRNITVEAGDSVHLLVDEEFGTPEQVTTTLLDGPGGQQALGATTDAVYLVSLENGAYRIRVDVTYANIEGRQTFVSYIFGLDVQGGVVAAVPSPTPVVVAPTEEPTEEPTATIEPTEIVTAEPTEEPALTAEPTEQPVTKPTQTKVVLPTATVVEAAETAEVASVPSATPAAVAAQPTATQQATKAPVQPTATRPTVLTSPVPPTSTEVLEVPPTATVIPTETPLTAAPTLTPISGVQPTATLIAALPTVPDMTLNFAGQNYTPVGYQYCQREASGQRVCVELPAETVNPTRITLLRGSAVQLRIAGTRPVEARIEYLSDMGVSTGQPEIKRGDNIVLFSVMPEPGTYILAIRVTWQNEDATYYFRVAVTD